MNVANNSVTGKTENVKVYSFTEQLIVPVFEAGQSRLEEIGHRLSDRNALISYLDTPQLHPLEDLIIELKSGVQELANLDNYHIGNLIVAIDVKVEKKGIALNLEEVLALITQFISWIRIRIGQANVNESVRYLYPVLILTNTFPAMTSPEIRKNIDKLTANLVLGLVPITFNFTEEARERMISKDFGYLENDPYKFSPYGCLIYDRNYDRGSVLYIQEQVIPHIANIRGVQYFLESLNKILNDKIKDGSKSDTKKKRDELFQIRETALKGLTVVENTRSYKHLSEISDLLRSMFDIDRLQANIEKKIEVLDAIFEKMQNESDAALSKKLNYVGIALTVIGVLLAIIALPPILKIFGS